MEKQEGVDEHTPHPLLRGFIKGGEEEFREEHDCSFSRENKRLLCEIKALRARDLIARQILFNLHKKHEFLSSLEDLKKTSPDLLNVFLESSRDF